MSSAPEDVSADDAAAPVVPAGPAPRVVPLPHLNEAYWNDVVMANVPAEGARLNWPELRSRLRAISSNERADFDGLRAGIVRFGTGAFFGSVLPFISQLVRQTPDYFAEPLPFLIQDRPQTISLTRLQVAILMANGFFSTFEFYRNEETSWLSRGENCLLNQSTFNFSFLWNSPSEYQQVVQKTVGFLHYFDRMRELSEKQSAAQSPGGGLITLDLQLSDLVFYSRLVLARYSTKYDNPFLKVPSPALCPIEFVHGGRVQDVPNSRQIDFAAPCVGGSVIGGGCRTEEMRFLNCPECCVGILLAHRMMGHEAILFRNVAEFVRCSGYARSMRCEGRVDEATEQQAGSFEIAAMDAHQFTAENRRIQWERDWVEREVYKAYCGFSQQSAEDHADVAPYCCATFRNISTGCWGCGRFQGDLILKFLAQWLAASTLKWPKLTFGFFGDPAALERLRQFVESLLWGRDVTAQVLFKALVAAGEICEEKQWDVEGVDPLKLMEVILEGREVGATLRDVM